MRRAGRRNHDVGGAQRRRDLRHLDGVPKADLGDEFVRARDRAIGDDHARSALGAQTLGGYASHFARSDDEHGYALEPAEALAREVDGGGCDASGFVADRRARPRGLSRVERFAEQAVQRLAERSGALRGGVRVLDLAEYFGFADQHRIQAGRDAEEMFDRLRAQMRVKIRFEIVHDGGVAEVCEELLELRDARFEVVQVGVDLEPAAGLQHRGFANRGVVAQRDERLGHARRREGVAFADFDRRGAMREAQTDDRHARMPYPRPGARLRLRSCFPS